MILDEEIEGGVEGKKGGTRIMYLIRLETVGRVEREWRVSKRASSCWMGGVGSEGEGLRLVSCCSRFFPVVVRSLQSDSKSSSSTSFPFPLISKCALITITLDGNNFDKNNSPMNFMSVI